MRDDDALERNPLIARKDLESMHGELYGWALSRCAFDASTAEDLLQQTYVELLSGRAIFKKGSSLKTFVFGVIQNLARSRFRRQNTRLRVINNYVAEQPELSECPPERENLKIVWEAVELLPQRQRDITELIFIRDMTIEQASVVMGVSIGTGRIHYARAKQSLATSLAALRAIESRQ